MSKIIWAGQSCFQIAVSNSKDHSAQIVIDPFDEKIGLKAPRFSADILLITHNHSDHDNKKIVKGEPFLIEGPGEFEVKGVFIRGISAFHDDSQGKERGRITIYTIEAEGMKFCHLGDLGQSQLTDEQLEEIGSVDVLMIPIGGTYTISSQEASKIISQIEPKIVIPMHYQMPNLKLKLDDVKKFLKVMGKNSIIPQEKFQVKENALPKEGMEIVILMP
ncbi:MBL fold metallo-hydrolase [Patescibacteria group bacterium]|nr:MBL fold metallo-hydrolase [Patescibacteria group bacterium]MBU4274207.1 MBL fold metallo-hydrolase [Patescibacteria group bacterium]MBU4367303.1 MBL fold metallo-hydrolase [Patescibacteria group bacterium]MBU4461640.1 MBL fold metallo-hydrolase [Patescibacteria group bacterium]MCG2699690.1 MBL fold metallo-hydrolase [Candidatus Parcubacteria bacterium]